jgi:hypothetical protein
MQIPNDATAQLDEIVKIIGLAGFSFMVMMFVFVGVLLYESRKGTKVNDKNSTLTR